MSALFMFLIVLSLFVITIVKSKFHYLSMKFAYKMPKKIFLYLFIFWGILSQGIIGICSEENIDESRNLHARKKRVIDLTPGGNRPVPFYEVPYIVKIKKNGLINCAGIIVSAHHILTAVHCIDEEIRSYKIITIGTFIETTNEHVILRKINRMSDYLTNDIALLLIYPPIDSQLSLARTIDLLIGPMPPNTTGTIYGLNPQVLGPNCLKKILVPIISQQECANIYEDHFQITDKHLCTFDISLQKYCSRGDSGAPLVVHSQLAGVLIFVGEVLGHGHPDIFINLDQPIYRNWIVSNIASNLQNQRRPFNPHNPYNPHNSHYLPDPQNPHYIPHHT